MLLPDSKLAGQILYRCLESSEMSKQSTSLHWKEMGLLVLFGITLIVLLFNFPKTTKGAITIGYITAVTAILFASLIRKHRVDRIPEIEEEPGKSKLGPTSFKSPKSFLVNYRNRFTFRLSFYAFCILCVIAKQSLQSSGHLAPQVEALLNAAVCLAASVFCGLNLFWGLRERHIWLRGFPDIARDESPANYWAAICGWTFFTGGFAAGLIFEFYKLIARQ